MSESVVTFSSGGLTLEGCLMLPRGAESRGGVVLCHPHPLYGGDMDNNVLVSVGNSLVKKGLAVLRFNFRGVGLSQGFYDGGRGEQDDAAAALEFLAGLKEIGREQLGIMGYSFGGTVALAVANNNPLVKAAAAVSPVVSPGLFRSLTKPILIVCGEKDTIVPLSDLEKESGNYLKEENIKVIPGADHFWGGHEDKVAEALADFFASTLL